MDKREWTTVFGLSFMPLVLWILFIVYNFDLSSSAFTWPVFPLPTLLYIGLQSCLALLTFAEQIGKISGKLYLAVSLLGEQIRRGF